MQLLPYLGYKATTVWAFDELGSLGGEGQVSVHVRGKVSVRVCFCHSLRFSWAYNVHLAC